MRRGGGVHPGGSAPKLQNGRRFVICSVNMCRPLFKISFCCRLNRRKVWRYKHCLVAYGFLVNMAMYVQWKEACVNIEISRRILYRCELKWLLTGRLVYENKMDSIYFWYINFTVQLKQGYC